MDRHEDAADVLLAGESAARRVYVDGNAWMLGNYLAKLGEAQAGLGRFPEAETTLLEAHGLLAEGLGDEHQRTVKCVERLITLYKSWHAAEPGQGYDAKAAEWRAKLPHTDPDP